MLVGHESIDRQHGFWLPFGYHLERDTDLLILRRSDGTFVAAFSAVGTDLFEVELTVWKTQINSVVRSARGNYFRIVQSSGSYKIPDPRPGPLACGLQPAVKVRSHGQPFRVVVVAVLEHLADGAFHFRLRRGLARRIASYRWRPRRPHNATISTPVDATLSVCLILVILPAVSVTVTVTAQIQGRRGPCILLSFAGRIR
jgi:hypothetical protein